MSRDIRKIAASIMKAIILFPFLFVACQVGSRHPIAKKPKAIYLDSFHEGQSFKGRIYPDGDTVFASFKRWHEDEEKIFGHSYVKISWADSLKGINMLITTGDSIYYYDSLKAYPPNDHAIEFLDIPDTASLIHGDDQYYATSWGQKRVISKRFWLFPGNRKVIQLRYWYTKIPASFDILTSMDSIPYYDRKLGWTKLYLDRAVNSDEKGNAKIRYGFMNEDYQVVAFKIITTTGDSLKFYDNKFGYKPTIIN